MPLAETSTISTFKLWWYWVIITIFQVLSIPWTQLYILWILMVMDLISWVAKQYTIDPQWITSHRMWLWMIKKLITLMSIFAIALTLLALEISPIDKQTWLKIILSVFIWNELYSILGNTYTVRTWKKVTEYDAISKVLQMIWNLIVKTIDSKLNTDKEKDNEKENEK